MLAGPGAATATSQQMADLAKGALRKKIPELELALKGKSKNTIVSVGVQLRRLQRGRGSRPSRATSPREAKPYAMQLGLLQEIPGVD